MKKQIFARGAIGALGGVFIGQIVMIVISLSVDGGEFMPVPPVLAEQVGSELKAYILQFLGLMVYGAVWAGASVVWETDWSLTKQSIVHCLCYALSALPIATMLQWFPHTAAGFLGYFGGFAATYLALWCGQFMSMRARVRAMNRKLGQI